MKNWTDDEKPSNGPRKKNTKKWCKGKVGTSHQIEIALHHYYGTSSDRPAPERYKELAARGLKHFDRPWICFHEYRCTVCGKYTGIVGWEKCPDYAKYLEEKHATV